MVLDWGDVRFLRKVICVITILNAKKTKTMCVSGIEPETIQLRAEGKALEQVHQYTYLGVTIIQHYGAGERNQKEDCDCKIQILGEQGIPEKKPLFKSQNEVA
ncbi:hypothetical protein CAPTEDRAFT_185280 [Capitella teleta]|uniref:Uncharacterized protein n=1 Tax=Capitella teleta TaxID=283909 RepID=R7T5K8_CAPTE|nr:hypothetical protein CAPTEDRAFT_185280 [Capitella teleta]|eukprot:ELT88336.1 hypothetical protein CAPTEDRAFT_185280 [Capitella teleta]